jgi:asparagine synthase (glutamine-hydrolysing)
MRMGREYLKLRGKETSQQYEAIRRRMLGQPLFWGGAEGFSLAEKNNLLTPTAKTQIDDVTAWSAIEPIYKRFTKCAPEKTSLAWMTYLDLNLRLPELLLMRVDKMGMAAGIEGRVPFLDHKFVELALSLPYIIKMPANEPKSALKSALRGYIPEEILGRQKQGFGVPIMEWLSAYAATEGCNLLREFCNETQLLSVKEVHGVLQRGRGERAWYLINLALWWKKFIKTPSLP